MAIPILGPRGVLGIERRLDAEIRIMALPRGQDPDELLLNDPAAWDRLLQEASPVADHYITVVTNGLDMRTSRGKRDAVTQLAPLIRAIGDPVERAHYMQKLATLTQSPVMIIEQAVARARTAPPPAPTRSLEPPHPGVNAPGTGACRPHRRERPQPRRSPAEPADALSAGAGAT